MAASAARTVLPGLRDHHVHLGLVDRAAVGRSVLSAVDDLGWSPGAVLDWRRQGLAGVRVRVAGPFLTAPGGYPSGRSWAPKDAVVALTSAGHADQVVSRLVLSGVDVIKVVLHTGMPQLGKVELASAVATAHRLGRRVVAHTEGAGQAARALDAGVDVLAHTPWDERLPDRLVADLAARMTVISTLAIHREDEASYVTAVDNLTRFARAGGRVRYGTDLGNGDRDAGLDLAELAGLVAAGLDVQAVMATIAVVGPTPGWLTWSPHPLAGSTTELVDWFATVRRCPC